MKSSKTTSLLRVFKPHEFQLFRKFLYSPYFNSKETIIGLYEFFYSNIKKDKNKFDIGTKEDAFNFVFPKMPFNKEKIIRLNSELVGLIQQFFVHQEIRYDDITNKRLFINTLNKRSLSTIFFSESKKLIGQLDLTPNHNVDTHILLYSLIKEMHSYHGSIVHIKDMPNLIKAQKNLDAYYLLSKLQLSCETLGLQNTFNENFEIPILDEVKELAQERSNENKLFSLYLLTLKSIQNPNNESNFTKLKALFFDNFSNLPQEERLSLFLLILNINGMRINHGNVQEIKEQLDLYKQGLEEKILIVNNRITPETFTNSVVLAAHLNDFKWAENFIKNYSKYLSDLIREASVMFCKGYIAFKKGEYEESIRILWNCKFDYAPFDIRTKSTMVRALTELFEESPNKYDFCIGQILTIEKYIRRKKVLSDKKSEAYLNFIKITKKILTLKRKNKLNNIEIKKLKIKISTEPNIIAKPWLLQKLN